MLKQLVSVPSQASLMAQWQDSPAKQEVRVQFGWEEPLEEGMAAHSSVPAWEIPWTEERAGYSPWGRKRVEPDSATKSKQMYTLTWSLSWGPAGTRGESVWRGVSCRD